VSTLAFSAVAILPPCRRVLRDDERHLKYREGGPMGPPRADGLVTASTLLIGVVLVLAHIGMPAPRILWPLWAKLPLLAVMCFGPIVPISHFAFVALPLWMCYASLIVAALLTIWLGHRIRPLEPLASLLLLCLASWIAVAAVLTAHESVPTPVLADHPLYLFNWILAIVMFLAVEALILVSRPPAGVLRRTALGGSTLMLFWVVISSISA
jgi:hypothetical protein